MKKLSKVLFGSAILAALVFGFAGCTEDDDDTEGAISGSGKNYSINYENKNSDIYRCYNTSGTKHLGTIGKITFNNQTSSSHDGAMGYIWDLRQSKSVDGAAVKDSGYQNFFVVGFRNNSKPSFYISKFFNVTDLQADNFGSSTTVKEHTEGIAKTSPCEIEVSAWTELSNFPVDTSTSTLTFWVDIYPVYDSSKYGVNITEHSSCTAGSYVVDIYSTDPTVKNFSGTPVKSVEIGTDVTGYKAKPSQGTAAVYANVQPGKTLNGSWTISDYYAEAEEVVEE